MIMDKPKMTTETIKKNLIRQSDGLKRVSALALDMLFNLRI